MTYTPAPVKEVQVPKKTPPAPVAATFATIQDARQAGAVTGTMLAAPLAPATGPIVGAPESIVVVTVKKFWSSPTIVALRNAVGVAVGGAFLLITSQVIEASGDLSKINWQTTQKLAIGAVAFSLASAYAAWWKTRDNNAVK
jgi:hypothetical protein